jgi:hypothetical protein
MQNRASISEQFHRAKRPQAGAKGGKESLTSSAATAATDTAKEQSAGIPRPLGVGNALQPARSSFRLAAFIASACVGVQLTPADENALRCFDLNSAFGPCIGMTRKERCAAYERAVVLRFTT